MQVQNWKSQTTSEEISHPIDTLLQQLDKVNHIAKSGYWLSTDELGSLLNLDSSFIDELNKNLETQVRDYKFSWRNFECCLVDYQFEQALWAVNIYQNALPNTHSSQKTVYLSDSKGSNGSKAKDSALLSIVSEPEVIPSPYALIENFLSASQLEELLRYSNRKQPEFLPTNNSANDPNYRRSFYLTQFPEFSDLMINLVRKITPQVITHLDIKNFEIGQIESQMTAHNHGNYYKIHNDSGSPDSSTRVLTYVYYYHREPKAFTGGELVIYDSKVENGYYVAAKSHKVIQPTNNTIVFFPSYCMHEVLPVSCPSEYFADSRFTINGWVRQK